MNNISGKDVCVISVEEKEMSNTYGMVALVQGVGKLKNIHGMLASALIVAKQERNTTYGIMTNVLFVVGSFYSVIIVEQSLKVLCRQWVHGSLIYLIITQGL